ncbi:hypothetical protein BJV77DRAFT_965640 [Russula vinacea]|nr:hypothetical protein BJV77DRAFT_965640 [Russula vinacea]
MHTPGFLVVLGKGPSPGVWPGIPTAPRAGGCEIIRLGCDLKKSPIEAPWLVAAALWVLSLVVDEPEDGGVPQVFHGGGGGAIALEMPAIARRFHLIRVGLAAKLHPSDSLRERRNGFTTQVNLAEPPSNTFGKNILDVTTQVIDDTLQYQLSNSFCYPPRPRPKPEDLNSPDTRALVTRDDADSGLQFNYEA